MKKIVLGVASILMFTGLSFGAPKIHWPKLHPSAKAAQSVQAPKTKKTKKAHSRLWYRLHHEKKAKNSTGGSTN